MKIWSLLFLRVSVGLLLVLWGVIRLGSPEAGAQVADKYYQGLLSAEGFQRGFGAAEAVLGLLVVLGLFRRFVLPVAAAVLVVGTAAIWRYLVDPLGLYLLDAESRQVLFFPSLCVAAASLVVVAFQAEDRIALDSLFRRAS